MSLPQPVFSAQSSSKVTPVSTPEITIMLEPYSSDGQMRLYSVPGGVSYWTNDLPIYQGDRVKLDVFVATGADELQELKVRLDNQLVADLTKSPWSTYLNAAMLGAGYHYLETWAQVSGPKPQYLTHTLTFFVSPASSPTTAAVMVAPASQPVSAVKGQEQILSGGKIIDVPLENGASAASAIPPTPSLFAYANPDAGATVTIVLKDAASKAAISQAQPIRLEEPAVATIVPTPGSSAQRFTYAIVRGSQTIVTPSQIFSVDTTNIRLQPRTATAPGLLPGPATLWAWGVDAQGNYGPPASAAVQIQPQKAGQS